MVSREKRRGMIEPGHPKLSLSRQCRLRRLMRLMGLEAIYQAPRTTRPHPEHRVYSQKQVQTRNAVSGYGCLFRMSDT